ncbi:hypothetical protein HYH02_007724 [Chlamydomonas schloesseri]|uniref:Uncharacterized protein n=1 Tax=Chlamydomonas schloesseri TaxID=2026947 RepID=A0A836B4J5_9CHLO|nr:hypothetical protein HYH02_007724 [Chlamydomonas schloesseri]|eukprot:KAG2447397.1 hypothetical protein HYH02_007724 [Chlamydomonas schloesseri]
MNLAAHLAAPAGVNAKVLFPLLLYSCRLCASGRLAIRGPGAAPPESTLRALLRRHPLSSLVHVALFVSMLGATSHEVDARVELAACLLEAACALTCLSWHGAKVPGGPPHPAALLAGRALVPLVNLGLAYAAGRWRPAWGLLRAGAGGRKGAAKSAAKSEGLPAAAGQGPAQATDGSGLVRLTGAATAAAAQGVPEREHHAAACPWGSSSSSSSGNGGIGIGLCDRCRPRSEVAVEGASHGLPANAVRTPQQQGVSLPLPVTPGCMEFPAAPATPPAEEGAAHAAVHGSTAGAAAAAAGATGGVASQQQQQEEEEEEEEGAMAAQPPCLPDQQPSAAEAVALRMGMQQRTARRAVGGHQQPVYVPFLRVTTCHYKIPWAEPEDIAPGLEERLAALCATHGRVLTGVYVRAGCIELSFILAERAGNGQQQLPAGAAGGRGNRHLTADHPDGDLSELLRPEQLLAALGLLSPGSTTVSNGVPNTARSSASAANSTSSSGSASSRGSSIDASGGCSSDMPATAPGPAAITAAAGWRHPDARVLHIARMSSTQRNGPSVRARVVDVSPRVLLLPLPSIATDGAAAVAPAALRLRVAFSGGAGPAAADDVVVRCGSGYLAVRVAATQLSAADEGEAVGAQEWEYAVELVESPPHPQLLTVQLAFPAAAATAAAGAGDTHNALVQWLSVPVLALDDAAVAAELGAALLQQQVEQQDASPACMEELVCDLGQWLAAASGADATTAGAVRGGLPAEWVSELGAHLLEYAEGAGLVATAARIRAGAGQLAGDGAADMKNQTKQAKEDEPAGDQGLRRRGPLSKAAESDGKGAGCSGWAAGASSSPANGAGSTSRGDGLQEYTEAWIVTMCKTCQMVECLVALVLVIRGVKAGQTLWCAESAVTYAGLGMGTVTTLAGLWMTPRAWSRLALAARLPRFLGFMTSKFLLSAGALPPPAGAATYAGGPGILLLEGVILPSGCLLPPRTALLMSCLKLPLNLMSGLAVGAFAGPLPAALMALAVEAAALGTTLACHAYVRQRYVGINRRQA